MALGLFVAASVLVTTAVLVLGSTIGEEPTRKKRKREENSSTELQESERESLRELFIRETGNTDTLDELRKDGVMSFSMYYLCWKNVCENDISSLTTTASLEIVLDLVKLDLAEGVKPEEIVYGCCKFWPKKDVIRAVIRETNAKIVDVLSYERKKNGGNCLQITFAPLIAYYNATNSNPAGTQTAIDAEETILFLMKLGDEKGLEMKAILERTNGIGGTLFKLASKYMPNLAFELLKRKIDVNSIDSDFLTPIFEFEILHRPMIAAGVNPYAFSCHNISQADAFNLSEELISELNPKLNSNLFFSTTSLPCNEKTCDASCEQGLPNPWYYNNGEVWKFTETDRIGGGAEGTVFSGRFHGQTAAFKFVKLEDMIKSDNTRETFNDLNKRLLEMKKLSETNGQNILPFYGHIRQQLSAENVNKLGLGGEVTRYEVFITKKCNFNLADLKKDGIDIDDARTIIDQLIDAQEQLQAAGVSHNDIKPSNILVDYGYQSAYNIFIGDFGQADQLGGTPGWTPPEFINPRVPGSSDMYSFGMVILYVLCEDIELFFALRDNFVTAQDIQCGWYKDFHQRPEIKLITQMMKVELKNRIKSEDLKKEWRKIRDSTKIITKQDLKFPTDCSTVQGSSTPSQLAGILGRNLTETEQRTTFTRTHLQGDASLCWLYSVASAIHQSMKFKLVTVNGQKKDEAMRFLKGKSFHQNLRNEILFGLIPKTLKPDSSQNNPLGHLIDRLKNFGLLSQEQGILELLTVRKFFEIIGETPSPYFPQYTVDQCVDFGLFDFPIVTIQGHDPSLNPPDFHHAVVMTGYVDGVDEIKITLKNSFRGEHLEGIIDKNDRYKTIQLKNITQVNSQVVWELNYFWTYAVQF